MVLVAISKHQYINNNLNEREAIRQTYTSVCLRVFKSVYVCECVWQSGGLCGGERGDIWEKMGREGVVN